MENASQPNLTPMLLGKTSLETFWESIWNTRNHLVSGRDATIFSDCVTLAELDRLVSQTRLPLGNFDMAQNQKPLEKSLYCENGLISPRKVYDLHEKGATIILRAAHYWLPGLNRLREAAESVFGCGVQANVYLTPADNQSTPPHWDTHDLFVLQIAGSKRWPLFGNLNNPRPLGDERFRPGIDPVGPLTETFDLEAGDCLYLPRGEIHAPVSIGYSVHVALGVSCYRWIDIVQTALQQSLPADSILRQPVPPIGMKMDVTEQVQNVRKAMKKLASRDALAAIANAAVISHREQPASMAGRLLVIADHLDRLAPHDPLQVVAGCSLEIAERDGRALLVINGKEASFPASKRNGLTWLAGVSTVTPAEFAKKMDWDEETGLAIAESLVEEGLLRRA